MKVTGIIVEYNPFHNGHLYHIQKAREITKCDYLIAVMSGNFVQRGEPAIVNKWERAKIACEMGVDLVLELPYIYATQAAQSFAHGAIEVLKLAQVDSIVFGSETNNLTELKDISDLSFDPNRFRENMDAGYSYPATYGYLANSYGPNDILAIAYLKEIKNSNITPYSIKRTNNYYDQKITNIASALAIRKSIAKGLDVSKATPMKIESYHNWEDYYPYLKTLLLTLDKDYLRQIMLVSEGIESHLIKQAKISNDYESFISNCVVKRYTKARIQRIITQIITQTTKQDQNNCANINYLRVLAYNSKGKEYLNKIKHQEDIIIASKYKQIPTAFREVEYKATVAYSFAFDSPQEIIEQEIYGQYK